MRTPPEAPPAQKGVGPQAGAPGLVRLLRASTAAAHDATEALVLPGPLDTTTGVVRVVAVQAHMLAAFAAVIDADPAQAALRPVGNLAVDARIARDDLAAWGQAPVGPVPGFPDLDDGGLAGARYVIEGARLGLRSLAPDASGVLQRVGWHPSAVFTKAGRDGSRWPAVLRWLGQRPDGQRDAAVRGAVQTFEWVGALAGRGDLSGPVT